MVTQPQLERPVSICFSVRKLIRVNPTVHLVVRETSNANPFQTGTRYIRLQI
jgi:hypothetical protein